MGTAKSGCAALCAALGLLIPAHAQDYAPKQIVIVVGFPAGGGSDLFARIFAQKLTAAMGANVLVENRPGAAGTVATGVVTGAAPNGQTLLFTPSNIAMTQGLYKKLPFDPRKDLAPITMTSRIPFVLIVHPSLPVRSVKEFIALAKARPGALDYASSGAGSPPHFAMELLKSAAGVNLNHVPYKGAGPITTAMITGETQASFVIPPLAKPHVDVGKLRALAVTTRERSAALPALPSLHEAGLSEYEITQWHAFFAPSRVPTEVVNRLQAEVVKALAASDVRQRLSAEGAEVVGSTPAELAAYFAREIARYTALAERLQLKPE